MAVEPVTTTPSRIDLSKITLVLFCIHRATSTTTTTRGSRSRTDLPQQPGLQQQRLDMFPPQSPISPVSPVSPNSCTAPNFATSPTSPSAHIAAIVQHGPSFRLDALPKRIKRLSLGAASPQFPLSPPFVETHGSLLKGVELIQSHGLAAREARDLSSPTNRATTIFSPRTKDMRSLFRPIAGRLVPDRSSVTSTSSSSPRKLERSRLHRILAPVNPRKRSFDVSQQSSPRLPRNITSSRSQIALPHSQRSKTSSPVANQRFKSIPNGGSEENTTPSEIQSQPSGSISKRKSHTGLHQCRLRPHPLLHSISHLRTELIPLISVVTGLSHPDFPRSLLQYHLLTHAQLDSLSRWYHQTTDAGSERDMYPSRIEHAWTTRVPRSRDLDDQDIDGPFFQVDLEIKRRRFGRFIGLRGCESPAIAASFAQADDATPEKGRSTASSRPDSSFLSARSIRSQQSHESNTSDPEEEEDDDDDITIIMERQWKAAMRQAEEERLMAEKSWRGRF